MMRISSGTDAFNLRTHRLQAIGKIAYLGFTRGISDKRFAFGDACRHENIFGGTY